MSSSLSSQQPKVNNNEVSREEAYAAFLTDPALSDINLVGTDGVKIPANRYVLSARSEVFKKLLLGNFKESSKKEIGVGYEGAIMKAIVEYIYTDKPTLLEFFREKNEDLLAEDFLKIQNLVRLVGAAEYYQLPGLVGKTEDCLSRSLYSIPNLAFSALQACRQEGPSVPQSIEDAILKCVRKKGGEVASSAVGFLNPTVLEEILQDSKTQKTEYELFCILQTWANSTSGEACIVGSDNRCSIATGMVKHINLEKISPEFLTTTVSESSFVTKDQLFEAFRTQALSTISDARLLYNQPRSLPDLRLPVWKSSSTNLSCGEDQGSMKRDVLESIEPLKSGCYRWSIELIQKGSPFVTKMGVGLASGETRPYWMYDNAGRRWWTSISGEAVWEPNISLTTYFKEGQTVTFKLDLRPDAADGGTLESSVDDAEAFCLFCDMRDKVDKHGGLVPVVKHYAPALLRLVSFEQVG